MLEARGATPAAFAEKPGKRNYDLVTFAQA